jgi:hypothetical protein
MHGRNLVAYLARMEKLLAESPKLRAKALGLPR